MHEDEKLVTIAKFESGFDAELAKVTLENAGIESVVFGEDLVVNMPTIEPIYIELEVFEKDADRARQVLAEKTPLDGDENVE
ncbi:MAG: putative signal transducing protein [Anaerohalosphaeraceae bacterium]|jgi:hypothetical protein